MVCVCAYGIFPRHTEVVHYNSVVYPNVRHCRSVSPLQRVPPIVPPSVKPAIRHYWRAALLKENNRGGFMFTVISQSGAIEPFEMFHAHRGGAKRALLALLACSLASRTLQSCARFTNGSEMLLSVGKECRKRRS